MTSRLAPAQPPAPHAAPSPRARDDGASALELIGVLTVVALLLGATLVGVRALDADSQASAAACRIMQAFGQGGGCDPDGPRDPQDYVPREQCVLSADGGSAGVRAGVVLTGGVNGDWLVEQLGDGTYRLTRGAALEGGAQIGIGFDVSVTADGHRYGAGASAGVGGFATFGGGEVHHAATLDEAKAILAARNVDTVKDGLVGDSGPVRWLTDRAHDLLGRDGDKENRTPDEVYVAGGAKGEATAVLNATIVNAGAKLTADQVLGLRTRTDGTSTAYFRSRATLSGDLQGIVPGAVEGSVEYTELSGRLEGEYVVEVEYAKDGTATAVTLRTAYVVDGTNERHYNDRSAFDDPDVVNEIAMSLPLRTDADREAATRALHAAGIPYVPGVSDGVQLDQVVLDRLTPWSSLEDFARASFERGQVWQQSTARSTTTNGFNFDAAYLAKLQLSAQATSTNRVLTGYQYWDGKGFATRPGCGGVVG